MCGANSLLYPEILTAQNTLPVGSVFFSFDPKSPIHNRCIGCGNCVVACPTGAMSLLKKENEIVPPQDTESLYDAIMANKKGKLGKIKLATKLMLKR